MRNWLRTFLFVSAFSPALLTLAYVRYDLHGWGTDILQLIIIGLLGSFIPFAIIKLVVTQGEVFRIQAKKVEPNDVMLLAFVASYALPLVLRGADVSVNTIVVILAFIGLICWLSSTVPAHPILRILKFRFYKLESDTGMVYTLISRRQIRDPKQITFVKQLSDSMLMEDGGNV